MKKLLWIAAIVMMVLAACNYTEGQCWIDDPGDGNIGAGGGPIVPGAGGYGNVPPDPQGETDPPLPDCNITEESEKENDDSSCNGATGPTADGTTYAYCSGACAAKCSKGGVNGFSPTVFKFTTLVPDDGKDEAGGWQVASATLNFFRWTSLLPESWTCPLTVGMPLRTKADGTISHKLAANITAGIASQAAMDLMHIKPDLPPGIMCSKLAPTMQALFKAQYPNLGATVK